MPATSSLVTIRATPLKCPGRLAPSSRSPSGPAMSSRVTMPGGYMVSTVGTNAAWTPAAPSTARSASTVRGKGGKSSPGPNWAGLTKIVTTTLSFSATARSISARWPPCRAPMVGTMPTDSPAACQLADRPRSCAGVASSSGTSVAGTSVEGVGIVGKPALADVVRVCARRADDAIAEVGVWLHEFRYRAAEVTGDAEQVVDDQNLGVAVGSGADTDRGDRQLAGDLRGQVARYPLENHRECPRVLQGMSVVDEPLAVGRASGLDPGATESVDGLGRESQVAHHRYAPLGETADGL